MKFDYLTSTRDGKMTGAVTSDYIALKLVNRSVGTVAIAESGTSFGFSLSDGGQVKFLLKPNGAGVVYFAPTAK